MINLQHILNYILFLPKYFLILIIQLYIKLISLFLGKNCRFIPSCSKYALEAIQIHGCIKGTYLSLKRLLKCNSFYKNDWEHDPVPLSDKIKEDQSYSRDENIKTVKKINLIKVENDRREK